MINNKLKGKKVIVTGGAGFIGSHLSEELVEIGAVVHCVDNLSAGKEINIDFLRSKPNFHFHAADVCDRDQMDEIMDNCYAIFHNAASKKNVCLIDPQKDLAVNGGGTLNLLELAIKHRVERFVHASTGSVYGEPVIFPTDESHPLRPVSYYGVSKLAGERYVDTFHQLYGLKTTILRYFHVYGPRQESNEFGGVVSIFLRNIMENKPLTIFGDGTQVRSFTWVKDLVKANVLASISDEAIGKVYNAASGINVTINELAEKMKEVMGSKSEIVHGDPLIGDIMKFQVSNEKIVNELGMSFEKDFWSTFKLTLEEFQGYLENILDEKK